MKEINRRKFNRQLAGGVSAAALSEQGYSSSPAAQPPTEKPNIVLVCSDQHGYKYTGFAGHPIVDTPNLDRIAGRGVAFINAYCGSPVCVPSRTALFTGMFPSDCNSFCNSTVWDGSHPSWGKYLRDAGYVCQATGKMDLNPEFDTGFQEVEVSHGHSHNPDITSLFRRPVGYRLGEREGVDGQPRETRHLDSERTGRAEHFIRREAPVLDRPWALFLGLTLPHSPFVALSEYYDRYYPNRADLPNIPPGHLEDLHLMFQELRHFKRLATPILEDRIRRARAAYYGMVRELDDYLGRIWKSLEETGQLRNTIFIYTTDHGESLGDHGLWYKNHLYDVAARVPLVVAGAGIPKGKKVHTPVSHVDLVRSILEWARTQIPSGLRGRSLIPLMEGTPGDHPGFAYSESHSEGNCTGSFMIRKGDWKYIHFSWYDDLLVNVAEDPGEFVNRIDDPSAQSVKEELREILHGQVNPEEVTLRAFRRQEQMLAEMASRLREEGLFEKFKGRLGEGQARLMAKKAAG